MKVLRFLILLILPLGLTSCLEILEEVNMNTDGSGALTLTINASQSKGQLDNLLTKDSIYGVKIPSRKDVEISLAEVTGKIKSINGISNVSVNRDWTNYILTVKCNFQNVAALNSAINNIWLLYDKKLPVNSSYFTYSKGKFKRSFDQNLVKDLDKKLGPQEKEILHKSNYTMIYRFGNEIKSHTNQSAVLSKSKKAIILKSTILEIITGKKSVQNEITLN